MDMERHDISWWSRIVHRIFMNIAKWLPAVQHAIDVQDKVLKCKLETMHAKRKQEQEKEEEEEVDNNKTNEQNDSDNSWTQLIQEEGGLRAQYPEFCFAV